MGVNGLWKLIEPAGKPVPLESLENKVLAVDVSIWLYQLTKGLQTTGGGAVPNAHILGLFNRICKLLYYRIKPVFVFDGGAPALKKETIEARRRQKLKAQDSSEKLREKLLNNFLKQKAISRIIGNENESSSRVESENDLFALPPLPDETVEKSDEVEDTDVKTAKLESFCNYQCGKDVHSIDITSQQFKSLPPEIRHEILSELVEMRKQNSWAQIHEMPGEFNDFSKFQMQRLIKRRNVQKSLDEAAQEIGGRMMTLAELEEMLKQDGVVTDALAGKRIAKDNVTRFVYISNEKSVKSLAKATEIVEKEKIEYFPPKSTPVLEEQFQNSVYEIDQCVFSRDSSSDDGEACHGSTEYATLLSKEENLSQEEILKVIRQQQTVKMPMSPQPCSSKSLIEVGEDITNLSDIEDEPFLADKLDESSIKFLLKSIQVPHQERAIKPLPKKVSETYSVTEKIPQLPEKLLESVDLLQTNTGNTVAPLCQREVSGHDHESNSDHLAKSMFKLKKMINSITQSNDVSEFSDEQNIIEKKSFPIEFSDSDDDSFIEVPVPVQQFSPYFENDSDKFTEISINPSKTLKNDIFADVFTDAGDGKNSNEGEKMVKNIQSIFSVVINPTFESTDLSKSHEKSKEESNITETIMENNIAVEKTPKLRVQEEELMDIQKMLQSEENELLSERAKQERFGSTITQQMIIEAQELLQLFGLPYIIAPMEAEAQCAFLDQASLTEGTITDDSDIWLFGGQKVYKNFFDSRKFVLQFRNIDIEHFFKLSREQLIQMALLVGSDYTVGVAGIGPVTAIEILAYFSDKNNKPETETDISETLRKFKLWIEKNRNTTSALSKKVRNVTLSESFPSIHVIEAYLYPTVDESKEGFTWTTPDLDRIREYMKAKFGWKNNRIDEILLPVMKRLNDRKKQSTLDAFFKAKPFMSVDTGNVSQRVIQAINIMKNKSDVNVSNLPTKSPRKRNPSKTLPASCKISLKSPKTPIKSPKSTKKRPSSPKASRTLLEMFSPQKNKSEVIPQREKDRLEAAKRKLDAVKIFKAGQKSKRNKMKRKVLKPKVDSSYLSESSNEDD